LDTEEIQLLRESVRGHLARPDAAAALVADGWAEVVAEDSHVPWAILFEESAASLSPTPVLDFYLLHSLGLASSEVSVVYARSRTTGHLLGGWTGASSLLWVSDEDGGRLFPTSAAMLRAVEGIDPELGLGRAELADGEPSDEQLGEEAVRDVLARGRLMQAFGLVATGRKMLELALAHVTDRTQFGRTLASFQAVKHQLAECAVELESARAVAEYAAESGERTAALAARALAGRAAFVTSRSTQQVMGAMGFTWEVPLHRYVRRLHVDDLILGPWETLAARLGRELIGDGRVPRLGGA
jgi:hypothetical protein